MDNNETKRIIPRIKKGVNYILKHWEAPSEGKAISIKEFLAFSVGGMGVYGAIVLTGFLTLAAGMYMAAALKIDTSHIMIIGIITSVVTIARAPLISKIVDNTNSKYGKFRPFLMWMPIPVLLSAVALAWIPPIIGNYYVMLVVFIVIYNILQFAVALYNLAFTTLVQVISPVQAEREMLMGVGATIYSLGSSIVGFVFPTIANLLFTIHIASGEKVLGVNTIETFKWVLPLLLAVFCALGYLMAFGTKERTITSKDYVQRVNLKKGLRETIKNKYFWLSNSSTVLSFAKLYTTSFINWICTYMIVSEWAQGIVVTVMGLAYAPGMLGAPYLIKRFGKKNIIVVSNILTGLLSLPVVFMLMKNTSLSSPEIYALIAINFIITFVNAIQVVTSPAISAQINDYQQFKSNERMEGSISQVNTAIITAFAIATSFIQPAIFRKFGYIKETEVLFDPAVINPIIRICSLIAVFSAIASAIPMMFWDLNEKKHENILEVLKVRAARADGNIDVETAKDLEARILKGETGAYKEHLVSKAQ
ncbi:MAG: MFS transporter [Clostridiales bacterium]|jgi:Na+/melibiose symporter-like transporter|nr:MFS transporter [Clostridiales bacterium]